MGSSFSNAFKRELGKNTAKTVSNIVFGDKWSTPYRRVGGSGGGRSCSIASEMRAEAAQMRAEAKQEQARAAMEQAKIAATESLYRLDSAVIENIDKLTALPIPRQIEPLENLLMTLSIQMRTVKYETSRDEGEIRNKYLYALIEKYRQCVTTMDFLVPNAPQTQQYRDLLEQRELEIFQMDAMRHSRWSDVRLQAMKFLRVPTSTKIIKTYLDILTKELKSEDFKSLSEEDDYLETLFNVYKEFLHAYKKASDDDAFVNKSVKLLAKKVYKYKRKLAWNKKKKFYQTLFLILFIILMFGIGLLRDNGLVGILLIILGVSGTAACIFFIVKKVILENKAAMSEIIVEFSNCSPIVKPNAADSNVTKPTESTVNVVPETTVLSAEEHNDTPFIPDSVEDDIFFDLNENNRIGNSLARIWSKYKGAVSDEILSRRPIFAADGVKDCILYVGVNPSYSAEDDQLFIENEDGKSLLYGSFYKRDDAPQYFKELESFAGRFGKSYAHMNLLYVRENDRDMVMTMNSEFIREQLELTYDTIIKLQPKLIVFFTTYCKNLIFGADRWVNPNSLDCGHYILNGTNIPVVFSEDIAMMDNGMRDKIFETVKMAF